MAGRHRARRSRVPVAAGATMAAIGIAAAVTFGVSGGDPDPGEAHLAAHQGAPVTETTATPSTAEESATKDTPTSKKTSAKKTSKAQAKATVKAPEKDAGQEEISEEAPAESSGDGSPCSTTLSGAQPPVAQVGHHIQTKFDVDSVGGADGRSDGDHGSGLALDFMVDSATGDAVADYVLQNQSRFSATYVIWKQRYNDGSGWSMMEDRGSVTANHYDHVHVSFSGADVDVSC